VNDNLANNDHALEQTSSSNSTCPSKRTTQTHIGDTLYIVEAVESEAASETVRNKLKRLILNNAVQR